MKELTSKKTGNVMIIGDETYSQLVESGMIVRYRVKDIAPLKIKPPEIIKPEVIVNKKK